MRLRSPDGREATLVIEVKSRIDPRDVREVGRRLRAWGESGSPLLVAAYLSPRVREELVAAAIGFADSTGALRLVLDDPAVFIDVAGATENPYPQQRGVPLLSLRGPSAARVVRALCDFNPPYGIRELASRAGSTPASVSRVVGLLDREGLLERGNRGEVVSVDWAGVLRRWTQDYSFTQSNRVQTYLDPRGIDALRNKLAGPIRIRYAVTGSLAAAAIAPIAAPRLLSVYVEDASAAAKVLGLLQADAGANVLVAEPLDPSAFERTWGRDGLTFCALSQVASDLLTSPGRGPAEAAELVAWMSENERAWRS